MQVLLGRTGHGLQVYYWVNCLGLGGGQWGRLIGNSMAHYLGIQTWMVSSFAGDAQIRQASPTSALGRVETRRLHFNGVPRTIYVMHPANTIGTGDPLLYLGRPCR